VRARPERAPAGARCAWESADARWRACALHSGALANTAEISTGNLRSGGAFDNIKASWNQALKLGDFNTNVKANYDYSANRDFLKDVEFSGDLVEGGADDVSVSYEVSHNFADKNTNVKLTAASQGTTFGAEYDQNDGVKEVTANRDVEIGDQKVGVEAGWVVKAKAARVKLMSRLGGGDDGFSAEVNYEQDGGAVSYEIGYDHKLEDGRDVSASFKPDSKTLDVDYTDTTFEKGATWTASASVPLEDSSGMMDNAKVTLRRAWNW